MRILSIAVCVRCRVEALEQGRALEYEAPARGQASARGPPPKPGQAFDQPGDHGAAHRVLLRFDMVRGSLGLPLIVCCLAAACSGGAADAPAPVAARGPWPAPAAADVGRSLYQANCVACHQPDGRGLPGVYPSLIGSRVVLGDPGALASWVVQGQRPAALPSGRYPTAMPQFGWMKPAAAASLLTYIRGGFGNTAPAVDAATVARALDPGAPVAGR
jgi:mono/diheme cytochrome c family protein